MEREGMGAYEARRKAHHQNDVHQWRSTKAMMVIEGARNLQG